MNRKVLTITTVILICGITACGNSKASTTVSTGLNASGAAISTGSTASLDYSEAFSITDAAEDDAAGAMYEEEIGTDGNRLYKITAQMDTGKFSLNEVNSDSEGDITAGDALFEADDMKKGDYIFMTDVIPEGIPSRMIIWEDDKGTVYKRAITESGKDGSLILMEVE